jgi:hypothetical protein
MRKFVPRRSSVMTTLAARYQRPRTDTSRYMSPRFAAKLDPIVRK